MRLKVNGLSGTVAALCVIAILLGALAAAYYVIPQLGGITDVLRQTSTGGPTKTSTTSSGSSSSAPETTTTTRSTQQGGGRIADPSFVNGVAKITYPKDYTELARYQLSLINKDRTKFGLSQVELSPIESGQQHADSMLYFGYFNHWDVQGYKPYMRYTLLKGLGGMEENVAYEFTDTPFYSNNTLVENALSELEHQMMYNDSACCQNGHRANILDSHHNRVSLGIEYDLNHVYLVQDFESYYIDFSQPVLQSNNLVRLVGNVSTSLLDSQVLVFYDGSPEPLNATQLSAPPYSGAYDQGTFAGGVVPPCTLTCATYSPRVTVKADVWRLTSGGLDIEFRMTDFLQKYGKGVYTVYLERDVNQTVEVFFDSSIFVTNPSTSS